MKIWYKSFYGLCLCLAAACANAAGPASGSWQGMLQTPSGDLTIIVLITEKNGALSGLMQSPDQPGSSDIPLTITAAEPARLGFDAPSLQASFAGEWDRGRAAWVGTWAQSGVRLPLVLQKASPIGEVVVGLDGRWEGGVVREGRRFRLILRVTTTDSRTTARFDAPDGGANNFSVSDFSRRGDRVRFTVPTIGARFDGSLAPGGERLTGDWFFPGRPDAKVEFVRSQISAPTALRARPQMPVPPLPYRVEEVQFDNPRSANVRLAGTLTLPAGTGPFAAVVLLTGSGAQDRDETIFGHKPFAVLADHLARHGIAALRYDDRGVGASSGKFSTATTRDFVTDAHAAVDYLLARDDVDHAAIGLIGHSEGGLVAEITASETSDVAYLVLLAAPAINLQSLMVAQHRLMGVVQGIPEQELVKAEPLLAQLYAIAAQAVSDTEAQQRITAALAPFAPADLGMTESSRELFIQQMSRSWLRELLRIDPTIYLKKITVPVLALNGSLDRQVAAEVNLRAMKESLRGSSDLTVRELAGINHMFQSATTGGIGEFAEIEETFAPVALDAVSSWIRHRFGECTRKTPHQIRAAIPSGSGTGALSESGICPEPTAGDGPGGSGRR